MAHAVRVVSRPSLSNVDRVLRSQAGTEALLCSQYLVRKEICSEPDMQSPFPIRRCHG